VCKRPLTEKYAIFDIAERRFFLAQNAPKSFVAGLRPDPLGELAALPQTTQLHLDGTPMPAVAEYF